MSVIPAKLLSANITDIQDYEYWTADDGSGDPWIGYPWRFTLTIVVDITSHSSHLTPNPFYYTADDVKVGDWIASAPGGSALQISQIVNINGSVLTVIADDVDRFNTFTDQNQTGIASIPTGRAFIFELDADGVPILIGVPSAVLPASYQTDLQGRFAYRNLLKNMVRKSQANHGFVVGDMIFLDVDGDYKKILADEANKDNLAKVIGQVNSVGTPGLDWFTFEPRGEYKNGILPNLPECPPGSVIYLDPQNAGKLTATKPEANAIAVYIRLNSNSEGIYLMGGSGGGNDQPPIELGPLGYYATVYRVDTIAARDALDTTEMKPGDQVYVTNAGNGEWAHYIASAINAGVVTWTKLVDQDASDVDGKTVSVEYEIGAPSAVLDIHSVTPSVRVTLVTVEVITPFNTTATLNVGDDGLNTRLVDDSLLDLSTAGTYTVTPSYQFGGTGETMVRAYFTPGTSTQGKAKVTISYI